MPTTPSLPANVLIAPERASDVPAIVALHEAAFGPGRFTRAAERVREEGQRLGMGEGYDPALSFVARCDSALVGSVRMTPVVIGGKHHHPGGHLLGHLLGPLAVAPTHKHHGIGAALIAAAHEAAGEGGSLYTLLVGDAPYYCRHGFATVRGPAMPGPVDPARLLVRWQGKAMELAGVVRHAGAGASL